MTHAAACRRNPGFDIAACVEPDEARRLRFMAHWEIERGYPDLESCLASGLAFDVASVCAPTACHADALERLLDAPVRAVFCEKPVTSDIAATRRLVEAYRESGQPLAVNYTRRWNGSIVALAEAISRGRWGAALSGSGCYDRGVLHHGSHMVDLIQFLVGPLTVEQAVSARPGHTEDDPLCDATMRTRSGARIALQGVDAGDVGLFELQLVFERGIVALEDFGRWLRIRKLEPEPLMPGRARFTPESETETDWRDAMYRAYDNLHAAITSGAALASDGESALSAEAVCAEIRSLAAARENQRA